MNTDLFKEIEHHQWPIVYRHEYNIKLMGLEKLHPFDAQKWGNIFEGNGHERDFCHTNNVYIMDVYNKRVYPRDDEAKAGIKCKIELDPFTSDFEYLDLVETNLEQSLQEFHPDIIVYNAGTDVLEGDRLGCLSISSSGVIRRDQLVFMKARERRVPIVMLTSGGYQRCTAKVIAESILNLYDAGLIDGPDKGRRG